jgi:hypothetical protein
MNESKDFENTYLVNGISLPFKSRTTLSNKLRERDAIVEAEVKEVLLSDQVVSIHLQTDLWQSPSKKHFISLIGTFVDKSFDKSFAYREVLLYFCEFGSQHTGQNIARAIFAILEEYKITSKLTGITTDGAPNNINMMTELDNLIYIEIIELRKVRMLCENFPLYSMQIHGSIVYLIFCICSRLHY